VFVLYASCVVISLNLAAYTVLLYACHWWTPTNQSQTTELLYFLCQRFYRCQANFLSSLYCVKSWWQ